MRKLPKQEIVTDVLVIGGGAAGMTAALEAREKGLDVTIVSKSKVGRSGNTIVAGTGLAVLAPDSESKDTPKIFSEDTIRSGKEINDRGLVSLHINGSSKIVDKLTRYGVVFRKLDDGFMIKRAPGHSVSRTFTADFSKYPYLTRGMSLSLPILNTTQKSGIRIIDYASVVKLLVSGGHVSGAIAVSKKPEAVLVFRTRVIILASGGGGRIFSKSNNTRDITGDSYSLAYDAGVVLRDMEFVQFYPSMMFSPIKVTISSPLFGEGAFLRNALGERFMERYDKMGDMATRDIMSRAMFNEVIEGRGEKGNIFMDCRHLPRDAIKTKYAELLRLLNRAGIDPLKQLIPISPATHFFMGGVVINEKCETNVPGLLACGESVGGLHGANRLAGNALTETVVFGTIAGGQAKTLLNTKLTPEPPAVDIEPYRRGTVSLSELRQNLRETTWKYLSIARSRQSTENAGEQIDRVSDSLEDAGIETVYDLVSFYELKSMITTARLLVQGSLERRESRGSHFRTDYPDTDDEKFKGNFFYRNEKGQLTVEFHPVEADR